MTKLAMLKTDKMGLESLDSANEMRMVRGLHFFRSQRIDINKTRASNIIRETGTHGCHLTVTRETKLITLRSTQYGSPAPYMLSPIQEQMETPTTTW